jgi:Arc/MetJ-type ribon-helix-helix transcriptional regulator
MELVLSPEALDILQERVASGEFATPEAVIDEALRLLSTRDREYGEWLRAAVAKGEESIRLHGSILVTPEYWERLKQRYRA